MVKISKKVSASSKKNKMSRPSGKAKGMFMPMVMMAIFIGSTFTSGTYLLGIAPHSGPGKDLPVGPIGDIQNASFGDDNLASWARYNSSVSKPEVITIDPMIAHVKPGDKLERMSELEGRSNFTDDGPVRSGYHQNYGRYYYEDGLRTAVEDSAVKTLAGAPAAANGAGSKTVGSGAATTIKREVEEADLVKVVGTKMFILNSYRGLLIVDISDPANAHIIGKCAVVGTPTEMYVVDFLAVITVQTDYNFWAQYWAKDASASGTGAIGTMIYIVNAKNPANPIIMKIVELEGFAAESRRVGHVIYQTTNVYSWYENPSYSAEDQQKNDYMVVTSIDIGSPSTLGKVDRVRFQGSANEVHASVNAFYVARVINTDSSVWSEISMTLTGVEPVTYFTKVTYLDIRDPNGDIVVRDTFKAPGELFDKYQMDEYKGMFRMVTHIWKGVGESWLFIFNITDPNDIKAMGKLLIDDAGSLMATRFAGERAYTIHLPRSVDPLDVLDLSDPRNPKLCDVYEMDGWVTHMEVIGYQIIALGVDNSHGERNVAVSLFDVTDPYKVVMQQRVRIGGHYAYSDANWEPKALTIDRTHNLVIVPYTTYSENDWTQSSGVEMVRFDLKNGKLEVMGRIMGPYTIDRTRVFGDHILATSFRELQVISIDDAANPEVEQVVELCVNVIDAIPVGGYFVQLAQDWTYGGIGVRSVAAMDDLGALDQVGLNSSWGKFFVISGGVVLVTDMRDDSNITGTIFSIRVGSGGKLIVSKIAALPYGTSFMGAELAAYENMKCGDYWRYGDYYYPWYYSAEVDQRMGLSGDRLIFAIPTDDWAIWGYDEAGKWGPQPMQRASTEVYVFDLSDVRHVPEPIVLDIETFQFIGLNIWDGKVYLQHQYSGFDETINYGYHYDASDWYYNNYVVVVDLTDPRSGIVMREYSIPGRIVGADGSIIYTVTDPYNSEDDGVFNILKLDGAVATLQTSFKIGKGYAEVSVIDDVAYIVTTKDQVYRWTHEHYEVEPAETVVGIIDVSDASKPRQITTATFEGYMYVSYIGGEHMMVYDAATMGLFVYSAGPAGLSFEAMLHVQQNPPGLRVMGDMVIISEGYYGVVATQI